MNAGPTGTKEPLATLKPRTPMCYHVQTTCIFARDQLPFGPIAENRPSQSDFSQLIALRIDELDIYYCVYQDYDSLAT
ncbi:hypothetical protein LMG28727_05244 [Paraburkholderia kirstenboschensis]|nr:hypothetical protein LMG28727_05244 [Paraburkholderia kirstenboschensis]